VISSAIQVPFHVVRSRFDRLCCKLSERIAADAIPGLSALANFCAPHLLLPPVGALSIANCQTAVLLTVVLD
jgi:hypothetical protein